MLLTSYALMSGVSSEIPDDPYIESTGYWQDISVDQSDDEVWKTTDMGWGVYPEVTYHTQDIHSSRKGFAVG